MKVSDLKQEQYMYILIWEHIDYERNKTIDHLAVFTSEEKASKIRDRFIKYLNQLNLYDNEIREAELCYIRSNPPPVNNLILRDKKKSDFNTIEEWQKYCNDFIRQFGAENHKRQIELDKQTTKRNNEIQDIKDSFSLKQSDTDFSDFEWNRYLDWFKQFDRSYYDERYESNVSYIELPMFEESL